MGKGVWIVVAKNISNQGSEVVTCHCIYPPCQAWRMAAPQVLRCDRQCHAIEPGRGKVSRGALVCRQQQQKLQKTPAAADAANKLLGYLAAGIVGTSLLFNSGTLPLIPPLFFKPYKVADQFSNPN